MSALPLRRWLHRRALAAVGIALLLGSALLYATRRRTDAPYRPGEKVAGITDVEEREADGSGWGIAWSDVAARSGIHFRHFAGGTRSTQLPEDMGSGLAFGDYNRDGLWDLFVADVAGPLTLSPDQMRRTPGGCRLYRNDGGTFTDVTEEAGLGGLKGPFMGAAWGDYDNDGYPDLVVSSYGGLRLFHNEGNGTFEDVTKDAGLSRFKGFYTGVTWGDYDGDGRLDLYVCGYVDYRFDPKDVGKTSKFHDADSPFTINPSSYPPVRNLLFHNEGRGRFRETAEEAGVADPDGRSLSATFTDFNNDGRPDLYVANDVSEGALYVNEGHGLFADRGHEDHVADYRGAMGIAVADVNGDGALDMFVTHWIAESHALYLNKLLTPPERRLDFEDAAARMGIGQITSNDIGWGTAFLDADGDGKPDLVVANGSTFEDPANHRLLQAMPMRLFRNLGSKGFADVGPLSGEAFTTPRVHRGLAIADVDGDLREEIAVLVHGGDLILLKAQGGPANRRVAFRCEGTRSNRSAYGTRLTLEAGGRRQIREIGSGASYLSQNAPEAIFGLGASDRVDRLTVRWPSGLVQEFRNLPAGRTYHLLEGNPEAEALPDQQARTLAFWNAYRRARELTQQGDARGAIAAYREALALNPRHEDSLYGVANLEIQSDDRKAAKRDLERLLAAAPRSGRANGALGDLLADPASGRLRDLAAARRYYETAGHLYTEETGWVVRLGEVELAGGDSGAAEASFRKVLTTNPRSFEALYLSGYFAWRRGDAKRAETLFDAAFTALSPEAAPGPAEGDLRRARVTLPCRGALSDHWAYLSRGRVAMADAYADLARRLGRS